MDNLNAVNLIQAATVSVCVLGALLTYYKPSFKGIALLLLLVALASLINILEESGVTRSLYLLSPAFIMLFGPANYLAIKHLTTGRTQAKSYWHLAATLPVLFFTSHVQAVILVGTVWRLLYAILTAKLLIQYKITLDEQRSDADEFSFQWLIWIIAVSAFFNVIDLLRLNSQQWLSHDVNVFGQGLNNLVWLLMAMLLIVKLVQQKHYPTISEGNSELSSDNAQEAKHYEGTFYELQQQIATQQWYLRPRLTLSELSELTGLQTRDISRAINLHSGKSFNEFINQYRIEKVCQELQKQSSKSLLQLAMDAGFSSKASFNKVFKETLQVTPSQFKARLAENPDN